MWKLVTDSIQPILSTIKTFGSAALITAYFVRRGTEDIQRLLGWLRGKIEPRILVLWIGVRAKAKRPVLQKETFLGMRIATQKEEASIARMQPGQRYRFMNGGYFRLPDLKLSRHIYMRSSHGN